MSTSPNTQATLLLTERFSESEACRPLSQAAYNRLAKRLAKMKRQPADLLGPAADELLDDLADLIAPNRLRELLGRGFALACALERFASRGIWVIGRSDAAYPKILKRRMGWQAPPLLFGVGNQDLLHGGGLAIVGSRDIGQDLVASTKAIGRLCAKAGVSVVSGGARGSDLAGMMGALEAGGNVVAFLAASLEKAALRREYRAALREGRLALVTHFHPRTGFSAANAFGRNKLIYLVANAAYVVNSAFRRGGTWGGASEQLQRFRAVPLFVRASAPSVRGLEALRGMGAAQWPNPRRPNELRDLLKAS